METRTSFCEREVRKREKKKQKSNNGCTRTTLSIRGGHVVLWLAAYDCADRAHVPITIICIRTVYRLGAFGCSSTALARQVLAGSAVRMRVI